MKELIADILIGWSFRLDPQRFIDKELQEARSKLNRIVKAVVNDDYQEIMHIKMMDNLEKSAEKALWFGDATTMYVLGDDTINSIDISSKIRDEELYEFYIVNVEEEIMNLIQWISESRFNPKSSEVLMLEDLKMLMNLEDEYVLSSNLTNKFIHKSHKEFNEKCFELIELNKTLLK